ncbi:MAG: Gfo/Idh/MocA family protein [Eggerthellaceae bacterium]
MDQVKIAVFGLNQGARIARLVKKNPDADLVAVAGFGQQAEDVAAELSVPLFADYHDLLEKVPVDAVAIALPNQLHLPATKAALDAGIKQVLLEKPIANTSEEGQQIIDLCKDAGATLLVGHHRRSSNLFLFLKDFLKSGRLGRIIGIQSTFAIAKQKDYWDAEWHQHAGGGPLLVNAIHDIDDLNNVTGMTVKRVYAASRNTLHGFESEDNVSVLFEFAEGATATYFVADGTPSPWNYDLLAHENEQWSPETGENSMLIFGDKGSFGFPNMDFYHYPSDDPDQYGWRHPLVKEHFEVDRNDPMEAEVNHFIDLALGRETVPRCSGEQALASLKVINAVIESSETGQIVNID